MREFTVTELLYSGHRIAGSEFGNLTIGVTALPARNSVTLRRSVGIVCSRTKGHGGGGHRIAGSEFGNLTIGDWFL
jgi:hypothetical protein